jgi:RNA polymerase sigma-70 factor, ECF subfamily
LNQTPDAELVTLALKNSDNYAQIIERYQTPLLRYIQRISNISRADAEDLLQNIFLKAYENLNDFDLKLKFSSWIYRIAHNEVISNWRRKSARPQEINLEDSAATNLFYSACEITNQINTKMLGKKINEILTKIPDKYRAILVLRFIEEKSYAEIGDILCKPGGTIATLINRAKKHFKKVAEKNNLTKFL